MTDIQTIETAIVKVDETLATLKKIDLRTFRSRPEKRDAIKVARNLLASTRAELVSAQ